MSQLYVTYKGSLVQANQQVVRRSQEIRQEVRQEVPQEVPKEIPQEIRQEVPQEIRYVFVLVLKDRSPTIDASKNVGGVYMLSKEASSLLKRLRQIQKYKKYTLSGIYDKDELDFIRNTVDKYPVIRGVDLMRYSPAYVRFAGENRDEVSEYIRDTAQHGFINTASWHWVPSLSGVDQSNYGNAFYDMTFRDVAGNINGALRDDVDAIAAPLKQFADAKVPVLWRPLHECTQSPWFWWTKDADTFKALWNMMYDRLVNHHGLDNLLFVWNPAHNYNFSQRSFYPGDDKVHVVAVDYPADAIAAYNGLQSIAPDKPAGIAEMSWNDWPHYIAALKKAPYSYVVSWCRELGAIHAGKDAVRKVYNSDIPKTLPWK